MKNRQFTFCVLALMLVFTVAALASGTPPLKFKFSKASVPGATQTAPGGINNAGMSVGSYVDSSGVGHGYILSGTKVTTLDDPNAQSGTTAASNIQYSGTEVVGTYTNSAGVSVGFLYKGGKFTDISGPTGNLGVSPSAINDKGDIVGFFIDSSKVQHGFLLKGGKYTTLDVSGATATGANGVNNKDAIVVYWVDTSGDLHSALTTNNGKSYKDISVPKTGALGSEPLDLNNKGDVCYAWYDSSKLFHGALLHGGKYYKFDYPKAVQTYGGGLNDKSTVVGGYQATSGGALAGYKATFK
jgi:probable HAF family extracellular repeat protein